MSKQNKNVTENCPYCNGTGTRICISCNGTGVNLFSLPFSTFTPPCFTCKGRCFVTCSYCDRTGKVPN